MGSRGDDTMVEEEAEEEEEVEGGPVIENVGVAKGEVEADRAGVVDLRDAD